MKNSSKRTKKDDLDEFRRILSPEPQTKRHLAKIIYDGRQYAVRIPMKFARAARINKDKDQILFELSIPATSSERPKLTARLVGK